MTDKIDEYLPRSKLTPVKRLTIKQHIAKFFLVMFYRLAEEEIKEFLHDQALRHYFSKYPKIPFSLIVYSLRADSHKGSSREDAEVLRFTTPILNSLERLDYVKEYSNEQIADAILILSNFSNTLPPQYKIKT
jgi:hypothetical protein